MLPYYLVSALAHFCKGLLLISAVTAIGGQKKTGKRALPLLLLGGVLLGGLRFSVQFTPASLRFPLHLLFPCLAAVYVRFLSDGSLTQRFSGAFLACLTVNTAEALVEYVWMEAWGFPRSVGLSVWARSLCPLLELAVYAAVYFGLGRFFPRLSQLERKPSVLLFLVSLGAYCAVMVLIMEFIAPRWFASAGHLEWGLWLFVILFEGAILCVSFVLFQSERAKQANILLNTTNTLMAQNYQELHAGMMNSRKNLHDFNHHLAAIRELSAQGKSNEVVEYVDSLLAGPAQKANLCQSGSDIIDAIINRKAAQAQELGISFRYSAQFSGKTGIDPVDICAVLANQIDNAFDACGRIDDAEHRQVEVKIWQQTGEMAFFQVKNTAANPFNARGELVSHKKDASRPHGLGLQSIRDAAQKYHGTLENTFENGWFTSTVFLCYSPGGNAQRNEVDA